MQRIHAWNSLKISFLTLSKLFILPYAPAKITSCRLKCSSFLVPSVSCFDPFMHKVASQETYLLARPHVRSSLSPYITIFRRRHFCVLNLRSLTGQFHYCIRTTRTYETTRALQPKQTVLCTAPHIADRRTGYFKRQRRVQLWHSVVNTVVFVSSGLNTLNDYGLTIIFSITPCNDLVSKQTDGRWAVVRSTC